MSASWSTENVATHEQVADENPPSAVENDREGEGNRHHTSLGPAERDLRCFPAGISLIVRGPCCEVRVSAGQDRA
jgi:hypothetical protein